MISPWPTRLELPRRLLGHDERIVRQRREWYRMYQEGELDLIGLATKAPLIAAAVKMREAGSRATVA